MQGKLSLSEQEENCGLRLTEPADEPHTSLTTVSRMVVVRHSFGSKSCWLCAKFPGSCHSDVSCVFGCHSMLLKKDDLLGQRSPTVCPRAVGPPDGVSSVCIRFTIVIGYPYLKMRPQKDPPFIFFLKSQKIGFFQLPPVHESCILIATDPTQPTSLPDSPICT